MNSRKSLWFLALVCLVSSACLEGCNNLIKPSGLGNGSTGGGSSRQEVWVSPNVASQDFTKLASYPDQWAQARSKITTIGFYNLQLQDDYCPMCGPNTLRNFLNAVPGGVFRWLNANGIKIAVEGGAIKPGDCSAEINALSAIKSIGNVQASGGVVSYIALDEPFASGFLMNQDFATQQSYCGFTIEKIAEIVKGYIDRVNGVYPNVQIGLIEPYTYFSVKQIESFIEALEVQGVHLPFFHLDFDPGSGQNFDSGGDIRELRNFFRQRNIPFGVIIIGGDGSSNETASSGAMLQALRLQESIGIHGQDHILFNSWLDFPPTRGAFDNRLYPDNLPETSPVTMMGTILTILNMQ